MHLKIYKISNNGYILNYHEFVAKLHPTDAPSLPAAGPQDLVDTPVCGLY
jgi:hypothetical protein